MIVILGVFQPNPGRLVARQRKTIEVRMDGRGVIVIRTRMHMLERGHKVCKQ